MSDYLEERIRDISDKIDEYAKLNIALDQFKSACYAKLTHAFRDNRTGWDNSFWIEKFKKEIRTNTDPVDIANYCMFLYNLGVTKL